jgi:mannose-6-phosphate isomerase
MADLYPMLIRPRYVERIWGGDSLAVRLGKPAPRDQTIGESWEVYDENTVANGVYAGKTISELRGVMGKNLMGHVSAAQAFPLLTKLIDAREALSVQVHPDDALAQRLERQPNGKTECWYVIDATPGAELTYGFSRDSTPDEYERLVKDGKLDQILRQLPVKAGDVIYIPAGTVHAIGAGIIVYELQQTSDVTYRIYDWNRKDAQGKPRDLHVDKARQSLDYHQWTRGPIAPLPTPDNRAMTIAGPYFNEEVIDNAGAALSTYDSPVAVCALEHSLSVSLAEGGGAIIVPPYASALIPAAAGSYTIRPQLGDAGTAHALVSYVPASQDATRADLIARGATATDADAFLARFVPARDLGQGAA